ncbi:SPOR domain-containing protein [Perlucidibaca aquatica]|uniref:SPOR domain-containing protein n=1 Tax=Perlucidibaca aquatica TaxID=1852776 RepID=UPI00083A8F57|nr:SPOR domain-containing protein [Perlucidibaca aquatica]
MTAKSQQRLGNAFLVLFVLGVLGLWLQTPVKALFQERILANVGFGEAGFSDSFGALPSLVKDNGGAQPVPIEASAPQRTAQYRDKAWLLSQDAAGFTLQIAVFGDERRIGDLLSSRSDKDQFYYVVLPAAVDAADGSSSGPRYVLTYGQFASRQQAEEVAAALTGLPGKMPRAWGALQSDAEAAFAAEVSLQGAAEGMAAPANPPSTITDDDPALQVPTGSSPMVIPVQPKANSTPGAIPVDTL